MKALRGAVVLLLDPRVVGPDAETEWQSADAACDYVSEVLTHQQQETVLDWAYVRLNDSPLDFGWEVVEVGDPAEYVEGEAVVGAYDPVLVSRDDRAAFLAAVADVEEHYRALDLGGLVSEETVELSDAVDTLSRFAAKIDALSRS